MPCGGGSMPYGMGMGIMPPYGMYAPGCIM